MKNLSKKTIKQMQSLGYKGVPTIDEAVRWFREVQHYYLLVIPDSPDEWYITYVDILHRHVDDGKLISFVVKKAYKTYDNAAIHGVAFLAKSIYQAEKDLLEHRGDEEWMRQIEENEKYFGLKK